MVPSISLNSGDLSTLPCLNAQNRISALRLANILAVNLDPHAGVDSVAGIDPIVHAMRQWAEGDRARIMEVHTRVIGFNQTLQYLRDDSLEQLMYTLIKPIHFYVRDQGS